MRSSIVPVLLWSYWANIVYFLGMIGYLIIDTISPFFSSSFFISISFVYLFLTIIFIVDAILYTIDWYFYAVKLRKSPDDPIEYRCEFVACIFQNFGSFLYFLGALFAFGKTNWTERSLVMNFFGIVAFLIESFLTLIGWWIVYQRTELVHPDHGWSFRNIYLWAHGLNIIGSFIYLFATIFAFKLNFAKSVFILQILGDFVYLIDAYVYHRCWLRDKKEFDAKIERENLVKLSNRIK